MQQLSEFVINHWLLVTAFMVVLGLLLASLFSAVGGVSPQQAVGLINREGAVVVDVRDTAAFAKGHIIDALNIPSAELDGAAAKLRRHGGKRVLVCCESGASSAAAVRKLKAAGVEQVDSIKGGIQAWRNDNLPLATS